MKVITDLLCNAGTKTLSLSRIALIAVITACIIHYDHFSPEWAATVAALLTYVYQSKKAVSSCQPSDQAE